MRRYWIRLRFFSPELLLLSSCRLRRNKIECHLTFFVQSRNIAVYYYYYFNMLYQCAGLFKTAETINDSKVIVKRTPYYESFLIHARGWSVGYFFHPILPSSPIEWQYGRRRKNRDAKLLLSDKKIKEGGNIIIFFFFFCCILFIVVFCTIL